MYLSDDIKKELEHFRRLHEHYFQTAYRN